MLKLIEGNFKHFSKIQTLREPFKINIFNSRGWLALAITLKKYFLGRPALNLVGSKSSIYEQH